MSDPSRPLDRATLEQAFERLGELAAAHERVVEISVYGGAALILTMPYRVATRDVDAVFESDRPFVRRAAKVIASEFGWPENWLNDGVKGFLSRSDADAESKNLFKTYPSRGQTGLRIFVASPSYLFAMKCLAMRAGAVDETGDIADIRKIGEVLGIRTAEEALNVVARYYPAGQIPPKTRFGIEEIFGQPPPSGN
ncbi:MAG TPA: hypothetical protein VMF67_00965 [Rhizomicrobium sp.]|nr:hypothetical protein [Rhizomicrobium sp.]